MTETIVASNTTDTRALATASLERNTSGQPTAEAETVIGIGGGVFLSAGHVLFDLSAPYDPKSADSLSINIAQGLDNPTTITIPASEFEDRLYNAGLGADTVVDAGFIITDDTSITGMPMVVYSDPTDAFGTLSLIGYPRQGGYDGDTQVEVTGSLSAGAYYSVAVTHIGTVEVLVSDPGMQVYTGHSGGGVWISNDVDGDGEQETYLAGITTVSLAYNDGSPAVGFEPLADFYSMMADAAEAAGKSADAFGRATLVSAQQLGASETTVIGTFMHEDVIGGQNADTLYGKGGDDDLSGDAGNDKLLGGSGNDTLDGGEGGDRLYAGEGDDLLIDGAGGDNLWGNAGADVFVMSADASADAIKDFEDGVDTIDVSAWGAASLGALQIVTGGNGKVAIMFHDEVLSVDDGARGLTAGDFGADDFVFADTPLVVPANTVTGTSGDDRLEGTAGEDVFQDGAGVDVMFGRTGADVFEMAADDEIDAIKDFQAGIDLIDISAWGATGFGELSVSTHKTGKSIVTYADEMLVITDGTHVVEAEDFLFA